MGRRRRKSDDRESDLPPARPLTDDVLRRIEEWSSEAAEAYGLVLFDVHVAQPWLITVYVDRPTVEPGEGITVAECARVSRYVEGFLDVDEQVWPNYTLEVSSPGIERKLAKPRHFELSVGRDVRLVVHNPIEGRNVFEGVLLAFDGSVASVECGVDDVVPIEWDNIAKCRLIYDFSEQ